MFVISIKKMFNYGGTKLDAPEYEYFGYDKYAGSFSTGYPTWMRFCEIKFKPTEALIWHVDEKGNTLGGK